MDNNIINNTACSEAITSQLYYDLAVEFGGQLSRIEILNPSCVQFVSDNYAVIYGLIKDFEYDPFAYYPYLLSPMYVANGSLSTTDLSATDLSAIEESGILPLFTQPFLQLRGAGVLIAIIDSGIDYTHPAFVYEDNSTKIESIWDQTIEGIPPNGLNYGTEYTREQINNALSSENPLSIVPSTDSSGHGTFLAGVAAGRTITSANFSGAAPDAELIIVKLKPAKDYLRKLYMVDPAATTYTASDIMLAVKYAVDKATSLDRTLVICISQGTNQGGHDGRSLIEEYLNFISTNRSVCVVISAGNETTLSRHASFIFTANSPTVNTNIRIGPNESGFVLYIWGKAPDLFSVGIVTPSGESVRQIPARLGQTDNITFILEPTSILIEYQIFENRTGDPMVSIRFTRPSEGIWTISLERIAGTNQPINMWLPCCNWISNNTYFIQPTINTTLTVPSTAVLPITVGGYNHRTNSIYINSSRGYTRLEYIKPDFVAPAVDVFGPFPNNTYGVLSGTSVAAAITAGAAALLFEWGINRPDIYVDTTKIKTSIIKGAIRNPVLEYPNRELGYGLLNLANTFQALRGLE
ncbi:MAG: peptidase and in kexin sedolisin [Clostridiales bacterium]|jgi:subtilisin family serine protease|nr:peptidase and in kexin sedolisin [Clostridiales bacterium]